MSDLNLAISIITHRRSQLLDSCLESVENAMATEKYPVYIIIQDARKEELDVLRKYQHLISDTVHVENNGLNVENLINRNRILAWQLPLIQRTHQYVLCLEDDVEVSADIFNFTEKVLEQNSDSEKFMGINFGSFEKPEELGSYSKLRYGLHGPASLISRSSLEKFHIDTLKKFGGVIPWDAWVEPIMKRGYVVTSNVARYRDNGQNGTHATAENHSDYFQKLSESFRYGERQKISEYCNIDIEHGWRSDCIIYKNAGATTWYLKYLAVRIFQIVTVFKKTLMG